MAKRKDSVSVDELFRRLTRKPRAGSEVHPSIAQAMDSAMREVGRAAYERHEKELRKNRYKAPMYFEDPRDSNNLLTYRD